MATPGPDEHLGDAASAATDSEAELFSEYARSVMLSRVPLLCYFMMGTALFFWPLDWLFLSDQPETIAALARGRVVCISLAVGVLLLYRYASWAQRWPAPVAGVGFMVGVGAANWVLSPLGGLELPWYHFFYFISVLTILLVVRLVPRTFYALAVSTAAFVGFFGRNPAHLEHPFLGSSVGQLGFGTLFSIAIGHLFYLLMRQTFRARRRIESQQDRLADLNATLEDRVAEQTRELRALTRRVETAVEEERHFLAREIHDQLGQELTAMRYVLAYAKSRAGEAPPVLQTTLEEAEHLLGRARDTMRRIMARLRPEVLGQLGLVGAVRWAVEEMASRTGVTAELDLSPADLTAPPEVSEAVFFALQEALTNVSRHADAERVEVTLAGTPTELCLTVTDNGVGLPTSKPAPTSVGMIGIRERVAALGGTSRWSAGAGGDGVVLSVRLPLEETS